MSQQRHGLSSVPITRDNANTEKYSLAARSVAEEFRVPFVDIYAETGDWPALLVDGLHFTPKGNHLLFTKLVQTIEKTYPHLAPEKLPVDGCTFSDIPAGTLDETREFFAKLAAQ